jgi:hypothetical protein
MGGKMMKKMVVLIVSLAIFTPIIIGQGAENDAINSSNQSSSNLNSASEWYKTYGGSRADWAYHIEKTDDDGYIISGISFSYGPGQGNAWLVKINAQGKEEWNKSYHKSGLDYGMDVVQVEDGYVVLGYARNNHTIWLFKTDNSGNMIWEHTYPGRKFSKGHDIEKTIDGGFIICGYTSLSMFGAAFDTWLIKTDSEGNMEWNESYDLPYWDEGFSIRQTPDGGYVIAGGRLYELAGWSDVLLFKINETGAVEWRKYLSRGEVDDWAYCLQLTSDGNYAIVGSALFKTDTNGNLIWSKDISGVYLQQAEDDGYVIVNEIDQYQMGEFGSSDLRLVKTNSEGTIEWIEYFGGCDYDGGRCIQCTNDGGYIVAGRSASFTPGDFNAEYFIVKIGTEVSLKIDDINGGLGLSAKVSNLGGKDYSNLKWKIRLRGKLFPWETVFYGRDKIGKISSLKSGENTKIRNLLVFGIGPGYFQVSAGFKVVTVHCRMRGPFIKVIRDYTNIETKNILPYIDEVPQDFI